jgi:hypothetical protein
MAYCIIDISNETFKITHWDILNLMDEQMNESYKCNYTMKTSKKSSKPLCGKNAIFKKDECFFCNKHANEQTRWFLSPKITTTIKKMKIDEINNKMIELSVVIEGTRKDKVDALCNYIILNSLEEIKKNKMTSQEMNLINVGRNMTRLLNNIPPIEMITHVIIENQISTIATRMKTIQGMLAQYFIMKCPTSTIEFISSSNKLKDFSLEKSSYKDNKKNSIVYCSKLIDANVCLQEWKQALNMHKKQDDLFDAFLQGIWFLKHNKIITYDDKFLISVLHS